MIDLETTLYILGIIMIYATVRWIRSRPAPLDPWQNLSRKHEHDDVIDVQVKIIKEADSKNN